MRHFRPVLLWCLLAAAPCYAQYVYANDYQCGSMVCGYVLAEDYNVDGGVSALVEADATLYGPNGFITSNWTQNYYNAYTPIQAFANTAGFYMIVGNGFALDPSTEFWAFIGQSMNSVYIQAALSVTIQIQSNFMSMAGNVLGLMGGFGGLQTPLAAYGTPAGGSYQWSLGPNLQATSSLNSQFPYITGSAPSAYGGDTWVQVVYTLNGQQAIASLRATSVRPTTFYSISPVNQWLSMNYSHNSYGQITGFVAQVTYFLNDQNGSQIQVGNIPLNETLTTLYNSYPGIVFTPPDGVPEYSISYNGSFYDQISAQSGGSQALPNFTAERSQLFQVNGFLFNPTQTQVMYNNLALIAQASMTH